jgi:hypothetical protein
LSNGEAATLSRRSDPWSIPNVSHAKPVLIGADAAILRVLAAHSAMSGCMPDRSTAVLIVISQPQDGMIGL